MSEPSITRQAIHVSTGSNLPVYRIVIHATCPNLGFPAASAAGTCAGTAAYFTSQSSGGSAQYIEGVEREDHCVADAAIAWHAPPNIHSIGIEITADGGNVSAFNPPSHAYTRTQWLSPQVWPAVVRAASRTRELCLRLSVPIVLLSAADLVAGKHGVCGHDDVSAAWHQTNHSDPGPNFPWAEFMALVMGSTVPTPEVDMDAVQDARLKHVESMLTSLDFGFNDGGGVPYGVRGEITSRIRAIDGHTIAQPVTVDVDVIVAGVVAALTGIVAPTKDDIATAVRAELVANPLSLH
jgi:hypothetical protein